MVSTRSETLHKNTRLEGKVEGKVDPSSAMPLGPDLGMEPPVRVWARVCFFCGQQGHGVKRWGWSGREGQPPGSSEIIVRLTRGGGGGKRVLGGRQPPWQQPVGCVRGSHWTPNVQGFPALGSHSITDDGQRKRPFPDDSGDVSASDTVKVPISPLEMGGGPVVPHGCEMGEPKWGMRPAGADRPSPQKPIVEVSDVRGMLPQGLYRWGRWSFLPRWDHGLERRLEPWPCPAEPGLLPRLILPEYLFRLWLG